MNSFIDPLVFPLLGDFNVIFTESAILLNNPSAPRTTFTRNVVCCSAGSNPGSSPMSSGRWQKGRKGENIFHNKLCPWKNDSVPTV